MFAAGMPEIEASPLLIQSQVGAIHSAEVENAVRDFDMGLPSQKPPDY
jgi:hypothetical protein